MNQPLMTSFALEREIAASYASSAAVPAHARLVLRMLQKLRHGALRITCPDGTVLAFGQDDAVPATLRLDSWEPFAAALKSGDIGFAESYIAGQWHTDDLAGLLQLLARNRAALETAIYGSWWGGLLYRVRHLFNRNSKSGSRRNIHAHYDIGNRFYQLWLAWTGWLAWAGWLAPGVGSELMVIWSPDVGVGRVC